MRITVPLPPKAVAQNATREGSWRGKSKARREYREVCRVLALQTRLAVGKDWRPFKRATITATFYCAPKAGDGRYRPLDGGNAQGALKAAIDALVDAEIFPSDDHRTVRQMPPVLLRTKAEHQGRAEVVLEIEEWLT